MSVSRVVTGHSGNKSVIAFDGPPPKLFQSLATPGASSALLWATAANPSVPNGGGDPISERSEVVPGVGETRLLVISFPPDSVMSGPNFDPAAAAKENIENMPELVRYFEPQNPGMHTTDTVDYGFVLDGEVWLEVDDGEQVRLTAGDVIVQTGTRHAWRNKTERTATLAFVLIGAHRSA